MAKPRLVMKAIEPLCSCSKPADRQRANRGKSVPWRNHDDRYLTGGSPCLRTVNPWVMTRSIIANASTQELMQALPPAWMAFPRHQTPSAAAKQANHIRAHDASAQYAVSPIWALAVSPLIGTIERPVSGIIGRSGPSQTSAMRSSIHAVEIARADRLTDHLNCYYGHMVTVDRVQTGMRIERNLLKVLKALAGYLDISLGDLVEGIALHAFDGKTPFTPDLLAKIEQLKTVYGLSLTAADAHKLEEKQ